MCFVSDDYCKIEGDPPLMYAVLGAFPETPWKESMTAAAVKARTFSCNAHDHHEQFTLRMAHNVLVA